MDSKSHQIFAQVLLDNVGDHITKSIWGISPDIDLKFLHRWYRHRISKIQNVYNENLKDCYSTAMNKDSITMCIISHLYLDIFNSWVFPFGIWNPIYPDKMIINDILDDIYKPQLLIEDLKKLSGFNIFSEMFYTESKGIMQEFIQNLNTVYTPTIIKILIHKLCMHTGKKYCNLYKEAMTNISSFTNCVEYLYDIETMFYYNECEKFEINYAYLINKSIL